jgi:hypothetical protein
MAEPVAGLLRRHVRFGGFVVGGAVLVLGVATSLVLGPPMLVQGLHGAEMAKAESDARSNIVAAWGVLLTAVGGLAAIGSLTQSARHNQEIARLTLRAQIAERYTSAVAQLGSPDAFVRTAGVFSLKQILVDMPEAQGTVIDVLESHLHHQADRRRLGRTMDDPQRYWNADSPDVGAPSAQLYQLVRELGPAPLDVQAAASVVANRDPTHDPLGMQIRWEYLDLGDARLVGAILALEGSVSRVNLRRTHLAGAHLNGARLKGCRLSHSNLMFAHLEDSDLREANLHRADLRGAHLQRARLNGADLINARLWSADLRETDLTATQGLEQVQCALTIYDKTTRWPPRLADLFAAKEQLEPPPDPDVYPPLSVDRQGRPRPDPRDG